MALKVEYKAQLKVNGSNVQFYKTGNSKRCSIVEISIVRNQDCIRLLRSDGLPNPRFDYCHTSEKSDKENGLLIHRDNGLQTVSVTSVRRTDGAESNMIYRDLVSDKQYQQELAH